MTEYIYTAKTKDGQTSQLVDVKIIKEVAVPEDELAIVQKYIPGFKPEQRILNLTQIDQDIANVTEHIAQLQAQINKLQIDRAEVLKEAEKVELYVEPVEEPIG